MNEHDRNNYKLSFNIMYSPTKTIQGKYIAPTNAQKKADGTYTYVTSKSAKELYPKIADKSGTNFFDSKSHWLSMVIGGQNPYIIKTSPKVRKFTNKNDIIKIIIRN